jgi:hypothetical protein
MSARIVLFNSVPHRQQGVARLAKPLDGIGLQAEEALGTTAAFGSRFA